MGKVIEQVDLARLPIPDLRLEPTTIVDVLSPDNPLEFIPGDYEFKPQVELHNPNKEILFVEQALESGIDGLGIVFSKTLAGNMNIGFKCIPGVTFDKIQMLCKTLSPDGRLTAGWTDNLLIDEQGRRLVTNEEVTFDEAIHQVWKDRLQHPTVILKVTRDGKQSHVFVRSTWSGNTDKWYVSAQIMTGMLAHKVA